MIENIVFLTDNNEHISNTWHITNFISTCTVGIRHFGK